MSIDIKFQFSAKPWLYEGQGFWFFVSFSLLMTDEIRKNLKFQGE